MDKDPVVVISPVFKGAITLADLLTSEGTLLFVTNPISIRGSGYLFQILYNDFIFCLSIQNSSVVFQRNKTISVLTLDELVEENRPIMICAAWSHYELILDCMAGKDCKRVVIPTIPTADLYVTMGANGPR